MAVGDVAVGEVGRRHQCLIGDGDPVVGLVPLADALQDLDRVDDRRFFHPDRLEPALERGVLLEVLAVLVEGRGADRLQLASRQHGLQNGSSVDGALCRTGPDQRVDLVDEQDYVAPCLDLLEDLLEAFLEVAAVPAACDEGPQVEGVDLLAGDGLGHLVVGDHLGQALDDGRLADTGLPDQDRVVLGAAGQHLHDPLGLAVAADDRVQLLLAGRLGEIVAELVQDQRSGRRVTTAAPGCDTGLLAGGGAGTGIAGEELDDLLADP